MLLNQTQALTFWITLIWVLVGWVHPLQADQPRQGRTESSESVSPADLAKLAERLQRLEDTNRELLEEQAAAKRRLETDAQRYRNLEARYHHVLERLERMESGLSTSRVPQETSPTHSRLMPSGLEPYTTYELPYERPELRESSSEPAVPLPGPGRDYGDFEEGRALPLRARLGERFELVTPDEEISLGFRVLNQVDFRNFAPNDLNPAISGLYIPRTRIYLAGQLTRPFQYEVSIQRSVAGEIDLLDAYLNFRLNEGFQLKFGRSLVPYSFDWYDHLEPYFITPERALFPLNFGLSRQTGLLGWGYLNSGKLEYAIGGFSGGNQDIADVNTTRDAVGYLNWRPFLLSDQFPRLRYLNIGGSITGGKAVRFDDPFPLRTSIQSTEISEEASEASITLLEFEDDVFNFGDRFQGALHLAYYRGGLSIESEVQAGQFQFIKVQRPLVQPRVPVLGYHVTAAYFLTGEEVKARSTVVPLRPFDPFHGQYGPGAIEAFARYSQLNIGDEVFDFDLANEEEWTNNAFVTDVGFNWYLNRTVKFYFDWQHSFFGGPVEVNQLTGLKRRTSDLFWIRCQVWF